MTEHMHLDPLSDDELQAFAAKLDAWSQELPERERSFLWEILERAAAPEGDVRGHSIINAWPKKYTGVGFQASTEPPALLPVLQTIVASRQT